LDELTFFGLEELLGLGLSLSDEHPALGELLALKEHPGLGDLDGDCEVPAGAVVAARWAAAAPEGLILPHAESPEAICALPLPPGSLQSEVPKRSSPEVTVDAAAVARRLC